MLREGTSAALAPQQRQKGTPVSFDYFILILFHCIFFLRGGKCRSRARKYIKRRSEVPAPRGLRPQWDQSSTLLPLHTAAPRGWGGGVGEGGGGGLEMIPGAPEQNSRFHSGFSSPFQKRFSARGELIANAEAPKPEPNAAARGDGTEQLHPVLDPPRASAPNIYPEFHPC